MSEGMIKAFLFYQRLARKEKPLLLLAGGQALRAPRRWEPGPLRGGRGAAGGGGPGGHARPHPSIYIWYIPAGMVYTRRYGMYAMREPSKTSCSLPELWHPVLWQ